MPNFDRYSNMFDAQRFARYIVYLRRRYRLSMEQAAIQCGISFAEWCKLEYCRAKNPSISTIMRIAITFGVPIDLLIGRNMDSPAVEASREIPINFLMDRDKYYKLK